MESARDPLALTGEDRLRELSDAVIAFVRPKVAYADLLIERVRKSEYQKLPGGRELVKPYAAREAMTLRLVDPRGRSLDASFGVRSFGELRPAIEEALSMLWLAPERPGFGLAEVPNRERVRYGLVSDFDPGDAELSRSFETLANEAAALDDGLSSSSGLQVETELWCYAQVEEKLIADTEGLFKTQTLPSTFLQLLARARDPRSGRITQQRSRIGDIRPLSYLFSPAGAAGGLRPDFREKLGGTGRAAVGLQRARALTQEELGQLSHLVLAPSAMVFVHEAEGHNFEADLVKDGQSGLFSPDGAARAKPFGAKVVDVYDGPALRPDGSFAEGEGFGTHFIDDEGVEVKPVRLVAEGEIVAKLHDRETAHHFHEAPNGRGFSELGQRRLVRMTNTYLYPAPGAPWFDGLERLCEGIPFGVYLEGSMGGAVSKEGMSTTVQQGRLIRDGQLTDELLLPGNLSVRTLGSLRGVEAFAGPLRCDDPGFCGKGQMKTVTDGGPLTRLRKTEDITLGF
ncbi:MAG: metallopeptidase TldD-related protein [Deltaproteobacteria bacterium]